MSAGRRDGARIGGRLDTLTGLRFVAAFLVFASHLSPWLAVHAVVAAVADQGRAGVSFFFLLSGLVLTWSGSADRGARPFLRRRFARIYPAFLVAWIAGCALTLAGGSPADALLKSLLGGVLLQSWVPSAAFYFWGNGVSWSLAVELLFYLLFPLLIGPLERLSGRGRLVLAVVAVLIPVLLAAYGQSQFSGTEYATLPDTVSIWVVDYLPVSRLPEFVLGVLIGLELRAGHRPPLGWRPALGLSATAYLAAGVWPSIFSSVAVVIVPFALLLWAGATADVDGRGTWAARPVMVWLGEISFCFYLVHQLVIRAWIDVERLLSPSGRLPDALTIVVTLGVSIGAAALLRALVERPAYRLLTRGRPAPRPVRSP